ncbi:MAG: S49 family peptidase [Myxococcota bacterium]|nr:S49 family peptidase [Myxococcota bacterium]
MFRLLLRLCTRPVGFGLSSLARGLLALLLRRRGVIELRLGVGESLGHRSRIADLEALLTQPAVRGVVLRVGRLDWGWAQLQEWQKAISRVSDSGRFVLVAMETAGNRETFLAMAATHVMMVPLGEVAVVGPAVHLQFYGALLERLGVDVELEAVGAYKSAGETVSSSHPSKESREALDEIVVGLHAQLVRAISEGRGLEPSRVEELIEQAPLTAEEALEAGLLDALGYEQEIDDLLEELLGGPANRVGAGLGIRLVSWARKCDAFLGDDPVIVVLHLDGPIASGGGGRRSGSQVESEVTVPIVRSLAQNPRVASVVLSIDSPGGSALASDLIWREVELLNREKPVVASLGNVAASGGYYIAVGAAEIVAEPTTITGSIGVIGARLAPAAALARLGVHGETITQSESAKAWSSPGALPPRYRARLRARLEAVYETFLQRVSAGRRLPLEAVRPLAEGRVWSAEVAAENGLVDVLGGLEVAIIRARMLAGVRPLQLHRRIDIRPKARRSLVEWLLDRVKGPQALLSWVQVPRSARVLINHPSEALTLLPFDLDLS